MSRLSAEDRRQRFVELARANDAAVKEVLTPEQLGRLRQIALQMDGPRAFSDPDVVGPLKLTAEQKERLRAIEAEASFRGPDGARGGPGPPGSPGGGLPGGPRWEHEQAWWAASDEVLTVLTDDQKRQWRKMTGEPIKGPGLPFPSPPRRFGPPR